MKVQLVIPPIDPFSFTMSRTGIYPPLNLITLANYLSANATNIKIEIIDGTLLDLSEILDQIDCDLIGISPTICTYKNALAIADHAKKSGAIVAVGGQHCSALPERILGNRNYVDYVAIGDGEEALLGLVQGQSLADIPNLYSRQYGVASNNKVDLNALPQPNFENIKLEPYLNNFATTFGHWGFDKAMPVYSRKGCAWQVKTGGCIFCRKHEDSVRIKSPIRFWEEISSLHDEYGVDLFWDVSDSMTMDKEWLEDFAQRKPSGISVKFLCYSRADELNNHTVDLLNKIGCHEVMVGMESGDAQALRRCRKGTSPSQNIQAARILSENGILVFPAIVLGLPSESVDSLKNTRDLLVEIMASCKISQLACTPLIPIPGSPSMEMLLNTQGMRKKYGALDLFNIEDLIIDWLHNFTDIDIDTLKYWLESILNLHPINSSFGRSIINNRN